jgi:hypothetical protein
LRVLEFLFYMTKGGIFMEYVLIIAVIVVLIIQGISLSDIRRKLDRIEKYGSPSKAEKPIPPVLSGEKPPETPPETPYIAPPEADSKPVTPEKPYIMPPAEPAKPHYTPPPGTVSKPRTESTYTKTPEKEVKTENADKNYENFIGGRLFPVLAAILIFIGMIFLCVTAFTRFGDTGKIAIMFGASAVVAAAGIVLTLRAKNAFTEAVTGCGLGMVLISLMATYFYFNYIGVAALIILLLVWGVAAFALSKKFDSFALALISHIGLTICFIICAFSDIGQVMVYRGGFIAFECAASALIIATGLLSNKKITVSGLIGSSVMLLMTTVALAVNSDVSLPGFDYVVSGWTVENIATAAIIIVQILLVLVVSGVGCFILERKFEDNSHIALMQSLFGGVYTIVFFTAVGVVSELFRTNSGQAGSFLFISLAFIASALVVVAVMMRMRKAEGKYTAAAWVSLVVLFIMAVVHINSYPRFSGFDFNFSLFLPIAFGMLLLYKFTRFGPLLIFGTVAAGFDWFYMLSGGFSDLHYATNIPFLFPLLYVLAYVLFGYCFYRSVPATHRGASTLTPTRIVTFFAAQICLIEILTVEISSNQDVLSAIIFCIIGTLIWCLYANLQNQSKVQSAFLLANEAIILVASLTVATGAENKGGALLLLLFAAIYAAFRMYLMIKGEMGTAETIYSAVKWLFIIHAAAAVFGLETEYLLSIIIIAYGLVCVVGGFALKNKILRSTGLIISLFAVVKMTIADVWEAENIIRVAALITGGVICFAISAIYNKTAKKLSGGEETALPESDITEQ